MRSTLRQNREGRFQALSGTACALSLHVTDCCRIDALYVPPSTLLLIQHPDISPRSRIQDTSILPFIPSQPCHRPLLLPPPMARAKPPPTPAPQVTWTINRVSLSTRRKQTTSHLVRIPPSPALLFFTIYPFHHPSLVYHLFPSHLSNDMLTPTFPHRAKTPPSHP